MAEYSIGLDLGGTNLRAAAVDRAGHVLDRRATATNPAAGREAMLGHMVNAIAELRDSCGAAGLAGIGIGVPGFILLKEGIIRNSNNLACLEDFPIRAEIEHRLGAHVILENDANAAALGEKWMGAGRDVNDLVLLTLGTGVGGGIISGGRVLQGYLGMAGELGHITVVQDGNPCGCGNQGCLEKHASATAIAAMASMLRLGEGLSAREVYDLALGGDEKAGRIFRRHGAGLGRGARHPGEYVQLSAVFAERRRTGGLGSVCAAHVGGGAAALVHVPHHRHAHRESHAGKRSRTVRRRLPAVGGNAIGRGYG